MKGRASFDWSLFEPAPFKRTPEGKYVPHHGRNKNTADRWRARAKRRRTENSPVEDVSVYAPTRAEAERKLRGRLADIDSESADLGLRASDTFASAAALWLARARRGDFRLSDRSIQHYVDTHRRHLADSPLSTLTVRQAVSVPDVRSALQTIANTSGAGSAKAARAVLANIFDMLIHAGVLDGVNPTRAIRGVIVPEEPRVTDPSHPVRDKRRAMTALERDALIAHALDIAEGREALPDLRTTTGVKASTRSRLRSLAALVVLLSATGARISEALTVRWDQVDLTTGSVYIDGTKTSGSKRTVTLPSWARGVLAEFQGKPSEYVAPSPADPSIQWDVRNAQRSLRQLLDACGMEWATSHSFRKGLITQAHEAGIPINRIADQAGHRSARMTWDSYIGRSDQVDISDAL